ncbi:hypothetical protein L208DRAFT_1379978 [Tricholoma matsutake]|nr:hypothetical protein L208DRAFT_1379978 [Tricholoma matsutake 945]
MTTSPTSTLSPSITVTADELAHALEKMGLTELVLVALLYDRILQLQSPPQPQTIPGPAPQRTTRKPSSQPSQFNTMRPGPNFFNPVCVEKHRKLQELMKESYPNGIPPPYIVPDAQSKKDAFLINFGVFSAPEHIFSCNDGCHVTPSEKCVDNQQEPFVGTTAGFFRRYLIDPVHVRKTDAI